MFRKEILLIFPVIMLFGGRAVQADTVWTEGHYEIVDTNVYSEIYIYNDVTVDMFGGEVYKLETFDVSAFDMLDGEMDILDVHDNSTNNIHGGTLGTLGAAEDALVNLFAYDVIYHPTGGYYDRGWVEGNYLANDLYFNFDLIHMDTFSHINVVPEPATLFLFGLGGLLLRTRR